MSDPAIEICSGEAAVDSFLRLPAEVYCSDPHYCPVSAEKARLSISRPEFAGCQQVSVACRNGMPVARLVARLSPTLRGLDGRAMGMIGFFDALNIPDAARRLLLSAVQWLRERGAGSVIGPMDGDTWHSYRLNTGPFDRPPFLMEPYNPPYYPFFWESAGFRPLESYSSRVVSDLSAAVRNTEPIARRCEARGYRLRPLHVDRFGGELETLHRLSCAIFARNFLYTDISLSEFVRLYEGARALLRQDMVWFAQSPDGEDMGFVFAIPDTITAVRAMRGRSGLLARTKFLLLRGRTDAVNVKTLGVIPRFQGTGVAVQLMHRVYQAARDAGFRRVNLCLIRDGNPSARLDGGVSEPLRQYVLYEHRTEPSS